MVSLSEEEENYVRISPVLTGISPRVIRTVSDSGFVPVVPPGDIDDDKKRWLVVGICLHSVFTSSLRKYVVTVFKTLYRDLKNSDQIDKQTQTKHLQTYGVSHFRLNYEAINNNKTTHAVPWDYRVQSAVDLSKLFCQTHMAQYNPFDGSCDSTALLGMINKIDKFPVDVKTAANVVRFAVRNEWAHCNFTVWDDVKYVQSLHLIEVLIYRLKLDAADEKEMIEELDKWRKNGTSFLKGYTISFELQNVVNEIRQKIQILKEYADVISTTDKEFGKVHDALINIGETLRQYEKRISTLENTVATHEKTFMEYGSSHGNGNLDMVTASRKRRRIAVKYHPQDIQECFHKVHRQLNNPPITDLENSLDDTQGTPKKKKIGLRMVRCMKGGTIIPGSMKQVTQRYTNRADLMIDSQVAEDSKNLTASNNVTIKYWMDNDTKFIFTRAVQNVLKSIKENSCVPITASPGIWKTTIRHVALQMAEKGYDIITVREPADIVRFYNPNKKTLLVIDDLCGNYKLTKIIAACRYQVLQDEKFESVSVFKSLITCNLLSKTEKQSIIKLYLKTISSAVADFQDRRADYNKCDQYGQSPLMMACYNGHTKLVRMLLNRGAECHKCDNNNTINKLIPNYIIPTEKILMADKRSVPLYLKLLESGFEKKRNIRLVVVGKKGAGKTSLIKKLFGEDHSDVCSTNGIEIHTIKCKAMSDDGIWNKLDGTNEETEINARLLRQYKRTIEATHDDMKDNTLKTNLYKRIEETKESETVIQQPRIMKPSVITESHLQPQVTLQQQNQSLEQAKKDIETMLKSNVDLHDKEEYATLLLWDFAGDEEFYHTHQTFLSPDAIYIVVINLNEADNNEAQGLFHLWMDTIHCYGRQEEDRNKSNENKTLSDYIEPPVLIVGTWKDAMTSDSEQLEDACRKSLFKYTEDLVEDELRHIRQEYFISNTEDDPSIFQHIREDILNLARNRRTWNTDYPIKFIQLEKCLQEKKKELPIISYQEIKNISSEMLKPLNDEELMLYLTYHHEIRALVYFKDLPDYIVLDTQWLSDAFRCIVTANKFRAFSIRNRIKWEEFQLRGNLHREVIEEMFKNEHNTLYKHKEYILNVMEKFDIIIRPNISDGVAADENPCYYVPCMNKAEPYCDIYEMFNVTENTCTKSTWLCYKFRFLPPHIMNHLIASLCRKYAVAEVATKEHKRQIALFKQSAVFELPKTKLRKLLVMKGPNVIQIQVWQFGKQIRSGLYKYIADFVTEEITKIISTRFKMSNVKFEKKWECGQTDPKCVTGSNYFSDEEDTIYYCNTCTNIHEFTGEWSDLQHRTYDLPQSFEDVPESNPKTETTNKSETFSTQVLQNLGKAEKTADDKFDEHVHNLERQQEVAHRFQKELRNYINCAKDLDIASKSFYNVMKETYEPEWKEEDKLKETIQSLELMWTDYLEHLTESVQNPLSTYTYHFQPLKNQSSINYRAPDSARSYSEKTSLKTAPSSYSEKTKTASYTSSRNVSSNVKTASDTQKGRDSVSSIISVSGADAKDESKSESILEALCQGTGNQFNLDRLEVTVENGCHTIATKSNFLKIDSREKLQEVKSAAPQDEEQQTSIVSLKNNTKLLDEQENFFKAALLDDLLSCILKDIIKDELDRTYVSFEEFINLHQHEIYHMCYSNTCCLCTSKSPKQYRKVLDESHLRQIFADDFRLPCHKKDGSHFCCCRAKKKISIETIDAYLAGVLLLNICNTVFWHSCLDLQSVTLEKFLNSNKHEIFHLWQANRSCCQCSAKNVNRRQNNEISKDDWKLLFSERTQPCLHHKKIKYSDEIVCCVKASRTIQIGDLRYELQKIILDSVCQIKDQIRSTMEDLVELYAYSMKGTISHRNFMDLYGKLSSVATNLANAFPIDKTYLEKIRNISECSFDDTTYTSYLIVFRNSYSRVQHLNLNTSDGSQVYYLDHTGEKAAAEEEEKSKRSLQASMDNQVNDESNNVPCSERNENIKEETQNSIDQQSSPDSCTEHAKRFDKFCITHELPLCDDCMKIHAKCTVSKLEVVAQGIKLTPKFTNIEKRIHNLSKYMNDLLPDVEEEIMLISDESNSFPNTIKDCKKDLIHMVDKFEAEVLPNIERHMIKMRSFHNKLYTLNLSVKEKEKKIAMCRLHASDRELILSLPKIEEDLKRFENQLLLNLSEKKIDVIQPIVKLRPLRFGMLNFQISYELRECPSRELSLIQEPFSLTKLQRIKDIQVDESFVFEIPTGNKATNITGCTIMLDGIMCFVDSKCNRFILRTADGIIKSFGLQSVPLDITAISKSEVAILHRTSISVLRVKKMQINSYKFKPTGKFRLIAFHKQNLIVCVGMCSFFIINLQGQKIKEINIEETLISCISCWNNKVFYANRDKNNIYSVDLHSGESALVIHVGGIVNSPTCIVSDDNGKFFVAGADNNNIVAISIYRNEYKEIIQRLRSINYPKTISYDSKRRELLICSPIGHSAVYSIN